MTIVQSQLFLQSFYLPKMLRSSNGEPKGLFDVTVAWEPIPQKDPCAPPIKLAKIGPKCSVKH